ncbi:hypothetical protein DIPPA_18530 [Diplonema papillatum]|nr:hypothetical protein DIPPA_18530 [Diplonema papillatum]
MQHDEAGATSIYVATLDDYALRVDKVDPSTMTAGQLKAKLAEAMQRQQPSRDCSAGNLVVLDAFMRLVGDDRSLAAAGLRSSAVLATTEQYHAYHAQARRQPPSAGRITVAVNGEGEGNSFVLKGLDATRHTFGKIAAVLEPHVRPPRRGRLAVKAGGVVQPAATTLAEARVRHKDVLELSFSPASDGPAGREDARVPVLVKTAGHPRITLDPAQVPVPAKAAGHPRITLDAAGGAGIEDSRGLPANPGRGQVPAKHPRITLDPAQVPVPAKAAGDSRITLDAAGGAGIEDSRRLPAHPAQVPVPAKAAGHPRITLDAAGGAGIEDLRRLPAHPAQVPVSAKAAGDSRIIPDAAGGAGVGPDPPHDARRVREKGETTPSSSSHGSAPRNPGAPAASGQGLRGAVEPLPFPLAEAAGGAGRGGRPVPRRFSDVAIKAPPPASGWVAPQVVTGWPKAAAAPLGPPAPAAQGPVKSAPPLSNVPSASRVTVSDEAEKQATARCDHGAAEGLLRPALPAQGPVKSAPPSSSVSGASRVTASDEAEQQATARYDHGAGEGLLRPASSARGTVKSATPSSHKPPGRLVAEQRVGVEIVDDRGAEHPLRPASSAQGPVKSAPPLSNAPSASRVTASDEAEQQATARCDHGAGEGLLRPALPAQGPVKSAPPSSSVPGASRVAESDKVEQRAGETDSLLRPALSAQGPIKSATPSSHKPPGRLVAEQRVGVEIVDDRGAEHPLRPALSAQGPIKSAPPLSNVLSVSRVTASDEAEQQVTAWYDQGAEGLLRPALSAQGSIKSAPPPANVPSVTASDEAEQQAYVRHDHGAEGLLRPAFSAQGPIKSATPSSNALSTPHATARDETEQQEGLQCDHRANDAPRPALSAQGPIKSAPPSCNTPSVSHVTERDEAEQQAYVRYDHGAEGLLRPAFFAEGPIQSAPPSCNTPSVSHVTERDEAEQQADVRYDQVALRPALSAQGPIKSAPPSPSVPRVAERGTAGPRAAAQHEHTDTERPLRPAPSLSAHGPVKSATVPAGGTTKRGKRPVRLPPASASPSGNAPPGSPAAAKGERYHCPQEGAEQAPVAPRKNGDPAARPEAAAPTPAGSAGPGPGPRSPGSPATAADALTESAPPSPAAPPPARRLPCKASGSVPVVAAVHGAAAPWARARAPSASKVWAVRFFLFWPHAMCEETEPPK